MTLDFGKPVAARELPPLEHGKPVAHDPMLTRDEVATRLGVRRSTLAGWACHGIGPPYCRLTGRMVRYRQSDVDAWMQTRMRIPQGK